MTASDVANASRTPAADHQRPVFVVRLQAERGHDDPIRALRHLLKLVLRRFGLRAISAIEEPRE